MRHALAHASATALMFLALSSPGLVAAEDATPDTTEIEVGSGLVCDTQAQVERYVQLFRGDPVAAANAVNAEVGREEACAFGTVAFVRGAEVARLQDNEDKPVKVAEILVIGIGTWDGMMKIDPVRWYTLFPSNDIQI